MIPNTANNLVMLFLFWVRICVSFVVVVSFSNCSSFLCTFFSSFDCHHHFYRALTFCPFSDLFKKCRSHKHKHTYNMKCFVHKLLLFCKWTQMKKQEKKQTKVPVIFDMCSLTQDHFPVVVIYNTWVRFCDQRNENNNSKTREKRNKARVMHTYKRHKTVNYYNWTPASIHLFFVLFCF